MVECVLTQQNSSTAVVRLASLDPPALSTLMSARTMTVTTGRVLMEWGTTPVPVTWAGLETYVILTTTSVWTHPVLMEPRVRRQWSRETTTARVCLSSSVRTARSLESRPVTRDPVSMEASVLMLRDRGAQTSTSVTAGLATLASTVRRRRTTARCWEVAVKMVEHVYQTSSHW